MGLGMHIAARFVVCGELIVCSRAGAVGVDFICTTMEITPEGTVDTCRPAAGFTISGLKRSNILACSLRADR